jgi:GTP cyclohydrolase IA
MTPDRTVDGADLAPSLSTASSANGSRPKPTLLPARDPARAALGAMREAAGQNGGQRVVNGDAVARPVDPAAAERAAADFLTALGIDLEPEQRRETPARMARAYAELLTAQPFRLTTFPNHEGYEELVLARGIPFRTLCEHHMLLFSGVAHVGYLPAERILGLSKLARLVDHFAAQPQTQERLTIQVAKCLDASLDPRGVGVVLEAEHTCMTQRGIRALGATTVTSALLGTLRTDPRSRAEFFAQARVPTAGDEVGTLAPRAVP